MPHFAADRRPTGKPRPSDVAEAIALLTRIPVPDRAPRGAPSAWAWPLAGAMVGLIAGGAGAGALALGLGPGVAAVVVLAAQALATGALHEDGLADCADGFWGGRARDRRLAIMADSRLGSYGALALVLVTLLRWSALAALMAQGPAWGAVVAAGALSRWPMAWLLAALPPARPGGLGATVGRPGRWTLGLGAVVALVLALLGAGWAATVAALAVLAATGAWALVARAKIGGQTGDVLGASQQLGEVAALLALLALRSA